MAGERKTKVTIEFGTDDASLQRALRNIELLRQSITGLGGVQSQGGQTATQRAPRNTAPPDLGGASQNRSDYAAVPQHTAPGSNAGGGGGSGTYDFSNVQTVQLNNVAVVNITAQNVTLSGGMGGGGGVVPPNGGAGGVAPGPGDPGDPGGNSQGQGRFRGQSFTNLVQTALSNAGSSPFMAQMAGTFLSQAGAVAPYAIPALAWSAGGNAWTAMQQSINQAQSMGAQMGIAAGQGQLVSAEARMAQQIAAIENPNLAAWRSSTKSVGAYQIADFLSLGALTRNDMAIDENQQLRSQVTGRNARMRTLREFGIRTGADIDVIGGEGDTSGLDTATANVMMRANLNADKSFDRVTQLAQMGSFGYAKSGKTTSPYYKGSAEEDHDVAAAISRAGDASGPMARIRRVFGGDSDLMSADIRSGIMRSLFEGDLSPGNIKIANRDGIDAQNIATQGAMYQQNMQLAQAAGGLASAQQRFLGAKGYGADVTWNLGLRGANSLRDQSDLLRQKLQTIPRSDPGARAELEAQIMSLDAGAEEQEKSARMSPYQYRQSIAQSKYQSASTATSVARYGGTGAYENRGFGQQINQLQAQRNEINAMLHDPSISLRPDEKAQYRAMLDQLDQQIQYEIPRAQISEHFGEVTSGIGVTAATRSGAVVQQQLFGSATTVSGARREALKTTDEMLAAEQANLSEMRAVGITIREENEARKRIVDLQNSRAQQSEQIKRDELQGLLGESEVRGSGASARASRLGMTGGSLAAVGEANVSVGETMSRVNLLRRRAAEQPEGSAYKASLLSQADNLETQALSQSLSAGQYTPSLGIQKAEIGNQLQLAINTRTFSGFGDVRGGYEQGLRLTERKLNELQAQTTANIAAARKAGYGEDKIEALRVQGQRQAAGLIQEGIGYQQALESGWQERLISEVHGQGGNFDIVASQFTKRESAMFGGIVNRYFGGTHDTMRGFQRQGSLWMNTYAGAFGQPEGFNASALSGLTSPAMDVGAILHFDNPLQLDITIRDGVTGNKLVHTQEQVNVSNQTLDATVKHNKGAMP